MNCNTCGTYNVRDAAFCRQCGAALGGAEVPPEPPPGGGYCGACGQAVEPGAGYCANCGAIADPAQADRPGSPGPVYGAPVNAPVRLVPNYLAPAILVTICCCLPAGIVAIVYAAQVNSAVRAGNYDEAVRLSGNARTWCWVSFGLGLASVAAYFFIVATLDRIPGF